LSAAARARSLAEAGATEDDRDAGGPHAVASATTCRTTDIVIVAGAEHARLPSGALATRSAAPMRSA
jgi:hypothetical protein